MTTPAGSGVPTGVGEASRLAWGIRGPLGSSSGKPESCMGLLARVGRVLGVRVGAGRDIRVGRGVAAGDDVGVLVRLLRCGGHVLPLLHGGRLVSI
jgi:hypothetical protein